jgi:putative FmdB family regulatory protein
MPLYDYRCDKCHTKFEKMVFLADLDKLVSCECGYTAQRQISAVNFNLPGNDFPGKNNRIKQQMAVKNAKLNAKQDVMKREAPGMTLAPNVGGERVDSWADAQRLAKDKGKDTASYAPLVAKEAAAKK